MSVPSIQSVAPETMSRRGVARLAAFLDYVSQDFLGGPRVIKAAWAVNFQKGGTLPFYLILLYFQKNKTDAAWILTALQGGYGLVWLMKSAAFPDARWDKKVTFGGALNMFVLVLGWYWFNGWLLISSHLTPAYPLPTQIWLCVCITICLTGCAIMIAADAQKFFTLRIKPGLIEDGMFTYVRHPAYSGEIMVYGSFAMLVWQWGPFFTLACIWVILFGTNMVMKERSLSRYPGWSAYRKRSWWLIPGVF